MTTREGNPKWTSKPSSKSGASVEKRRSPSSTRRTRIDMAPRGKSLPAASARRIAAAPRATPPTVRTVVGYTTETGRVLTPGTTVCADCLENPCPDQRSSAKNGRCRRCTRGLNRAAHKRAVARKERNADEAYVALYELQASTFWNGEV